MTIVGFVVDLVHHDREGPTTRRPIASTAAHRASASPADTPAASRGPRRGPGMRSCGVAGAVFGEVGGEGVLDRV